MEKIKIALVTGGGRGLGKDIALSIAKKGIDVVLTYNSNKNAADEVVREIQALGQKATTLKLNVGNFAVIKIRSPLPNAPAVSYKIPSPLTMAPKKLNASLFWITS